MQTLLQFQRHAHVLDSNARQIGSLERVVVDSATREVTHVVVRKGSLFTLNKEEKVVPIGFVTEALDDLVLLSAEAGDAEQLPPFEQQQIVDEAGKATDAPAVPPQPMFMPGYPSAGILVPPEPAERFYTETVRNIPEGTVAMKEGAKVLTAEGKSVGKVERVLAEPEADRLTHLVVATGTFGTESKVVPVDMVRTIDEDEVHLSVEKDALDKLSPSMPQK